MIFNIEENKEHFLDYVRTYITREGIDDLIDWLESTDFFTAPASTKYHSNVVGGLCAHSINVFNRLCDLVTTEKARVNETVSDAEIESIAIAALFHDVCKTNFYKTEYKNQKTYDPEKVMLEEPFRRKRDNGGEFIWESVEYYTCNDTRCYGHGECSVDILRDFISLTYDEKMAIRWHMGPSAIKGDDFSYGKAFEKCHLALLLYIADMEATYLDEESEK